MDRLGFKLILAGFEEELYNEFVKAFDGFPEVECHHGRFEDVNFDCVVSAANGFGLMDGGVDQCITDLFGINMMHRVQNRIIQEFAGEQPVGTSIIVRGNDNTVYQDSYADLPPMPHKYVAHTPTMRIPQSVTGSDNAYRAMKAALLAVKAHNRMVDLGLSKDDTRINCLVTPGLATLTGRIPYDKAARQMALAVYHVMNPPKVINWYYAGQRDGEIEEMR
jgi:O-acetyl-ADP-ribose deacetylase (regulator of RNase III)